MTQPVMLVRHPKYTNVVECVVNFRLLGMHTQMSLVGDPMAACAWGRSHPWVVSYDWWQKVISDIHIYTHRNSTYFISTYYVHSYQ
jgi:hypothetical protein